jgi:hypothetical protein
VDRAGDGATDDDFGLLSHWVSPWVLVAGRCAVGSFAAMPPDVGQETSIGARSGCRFDKRRKTGTVSLRWLRRVSSIDGPAVQ